MPTFFRILIVLILALAVTPSQAAPSGPAVVLHVDGPIGPATSDFIHRGLKKAEEKNASLVVLRMNTPGGLDTSMREIIQDILASPVPVATYVAPGGARAASAGTYILYASHVAAMAPGTNLGAATPIALGGPPLPLPGGDRSPAPPKDDAGTENKRDEVPHPTMGDKAVKDAVAYIRSLAQLRGRNVEWAEKAVLEAATLSASDALAANVIDLVATDVTDLLEKLEGRTVSVRDRDWTLSTAGAAIETIEPDWRVQLLAIITNPNVAYILLLVGIYGLIIEFYSPGLIGPGIIGLICLLLALYALHVLPVNYAGLALILVGIGLMTAEAFAPSFGILGLGGVAAFVIGSVFLLETDVPGFRISWPIVAAIGGTSGLVFVAVMMLLVRSRRRPVVSGKEEMIGLVGRVVEWQGLKGRVRIHSEIWRATSATSLNARQTVRAIGMDGLTLRVEPLDETGEEK